MAKAKSMGSTAVSGSVNLQRNEREFLGTEQIRLLRLIDEQGSITRAAQSAGISYKTAWDTVNLINNLADELLVERNAGGKGGGGTRLTPAGRRMVEQFTVLEDEHTRFLENLSQRLVNGDRLYI